MRRLENNWPRNSSGMLNLTANSVVFNVHGDELATAIREALATASDVVLSMHDLTGLELAAVTTKKNLRAAFAKFVRGRVLAAGEQVFDQAYVNTALDAYRQKTGHLSRSHFVALMHPDDHGEYSYKASYAVGIRPGVGLFLVALHSSGAITLPATFPWPSVREDGPNGAKRREVGRLVASELLRFVRSLDTQSDALPHAAFSGVGRDRKRREWFLTYATKLLLATGWHKPEDVNIEDLLSIKVAEKEISSKEVP